MGVLPLALWGPGRARLTGGLLPRGVLDAPRRMLDAVDRERVGGRRASLRNGGAMIELRGPFLTDGSAGRARLLEAVQAIPGVRCASVNAPLARLVVACEDSRPALAELVAVVDRVEADQAAAIAEQTASQVPDAPDIAGGPSASVDPAAVARAAWGVVATGVGLALSGVSRIPGTPTLPSELAALVTVVDTQPRLRGLLERALGQAVTDLALATVSAVGQGLAGGRAGLVVDGAHRLGLLAEARAHRTACQGLESRTRGLPRPGAARPLADARIRPLPAGPVERYADQAAVAGLAAFGAGLPLTADPRRATNLALATVPKAARLGREAFASTLGRVLARRGAVVLDPAVLRRLDRVDTVVLDGEVLVTGRSILGEVVTWPGADPAEVAAQLHRLFRPARPTAEHRSEGWRLGPLADLPVAAAQERSAGSARQRMQRAGAVHVLGLTRDDELVAVAGVVAEASESVEALAAAAHRARTRLVVAGSPPAGGAALPDEVLPGRDRLLHTVRALQADGAVVLLVSRQHTALGNADVGVGVDTAGGEPPWGAHVLVGRDLELAALLIEACGPAVGISRGAVRLAEAGAALGGIGVLLGGRYLGPRPGQAWGLAVNTAAGAAVARGTWAARRVAERPLAPPISRVPWHAMPPEAVLEQLDASARGLTSGEARRRRRSGPTDQPSPGLLRAVVEELNNPLTPILAGGAAVSAVVGSLTDAGLVAGVTAASALIGGIQRLRTDRAVAQLMTGSAVTARAWRDGALTELPAEELVPGDVVDLHTGDVVPADCRVLDSTELQIDEAALTGEPFPVGKQAAAVIASTVAERVSMVYEGTSVAAGRGTAVVVATGASTEAGRSMAATRGAAPPTGVETRLDAITRTTLPIALGSAGAVVGAGLLRRRPLSESLGAGVSLAVASVPEGLPFLVNAAQLASARRLSRHGALVRNPRTIEALGRVDVLCFDKTGTLTEGRITLAAVDDGLSTTGLDALTPAQREVLAAGLRATPARRGRQPQAHLTDRAVAEGAAAAGVERADGHRWRRAAVLPFEPSRGFHATLGTVADTGRGGGEPDGAVLSVKGAPETVLPRCSHLRRRGRRVRMDPRRQREMQRRVLALAAQGYRVLAVAERPDRTRRTVTDDEVVDLTLLGFLALTDPVRPAAAASVSALREAGVQIIMITGDHPGTAEAIARRLAVIDGGRVVTGSELDDLDDAALDRELPGITVVARGTPAHKVRVVQAFQRLGRTVAMTGDGANDAPAIRLADVGIALGTRATPAARAAADLVVTDDRLETILAALVEGRGMWASVREALGILVGGNLGEIAFTVAGAGLTGQSPLTTRQLLLVNLLTDLAPALAIALRAPGAAATADLLAEGPEESLGDALTRDITRRAATTAAATTGAWAAARLTGRRTRARTVALAALVGSQLGQTLAIGGPSPSVIASSLGSAAVLAGIVQTPGVSQFFGCTPLGPVGWTMAAGAATAATAATLLTPTVRRP